MQVGEGLGGQDFPGWRQRKMASPEVLSGEKRSLEQRHSADTSRRLKDEIDEVKELAKSPPQRRKSAKILKRAVIEPCVSEETTTLFEVLPDLRYPLDLLNGKSI